MKLFRFLVLAVLLVGLPAAAQIVTTSPIEVVYETTAVESLEFVYGHSDVLLEPSAEVRSTVTCVAPDNAPCNIPYQLGQGNSTPWGGAAASWVGFTFEPSGGVALIRLQLKDADGLSRGFQFTPDGWVDFHRMVLDAGDWMDFNDIVYTTVGDFPDGDLITCDPCDDCETCDPCDDTPTDPTCGDGVPVGSTPECCVPFGVPCNPFAADTYCCADNSGDDGGGAPGDTTGGSTCASGEVVGSTSECCVPVGVPCNGLTEYCCTTNGG